MKKNITSVALKQITKKNFMCVCYGNDFISYVVITKPMLEKLIDCEDIYAQVKKMICNYRVWNDVTDYIEQCIDIILEKVKNAK